VALPPALAVLAKAQGARQTVALGRALLRLGVYVTLIFLLVVLIPVAVFVAFLGTGSQSGGEEAADTTPGEKAKIGKDGLAIAPADAPEEVKRMIAAGNRISSKPYRLGGGHGSFNDSAYDCSGAISYVLHAGGKLSSPLASGPFMRWGRAGKGPWVTVYAHGGHAFMVVAGIRFDTSRNSDNGPNAGEAGPRWRPMNRQTGGFTARHPPGL